MNWGNKLILAFLVFAAGMAFLVFKAVNTNFELVEKDYYKKELRYQEVINGKSAAAKLTRAVELASSNGGVLLQLPAEILSTQLNGEVLFYCASDSKKDRKFPLAVDSVGRQFFSNDSLLPGSYKGKISWTSAGEKYYTEKDIIVPR